MIFNQTAKIVEYSLFFTNFTDFIFYFLILNHFNSLFSDVICHDESDAGADEGELDDEGIQVGSRPYDGLAQYILPELLADVLKLLLIFDSVKKGVAVRVTVLRRTLKEYASHCKNIILNLITITLICLIIQLLLYKCRPFLKVTEQSALYKDNEFTNV